MNDKQLQLTAVVTSFKQLIERSKPLRVSIMGLKNAYRKKDKKDYERHHAYLFGEQKSMVKFLSMTWRMTKTIDTLLELPSSTGGSRNPFRAKRGGDGDDDIDDTKWAVEHFKEFFLLFDELWQSIVDLHRFMSPPSTIPALRQAVTRGTDRKILEELGRHGASVRIAAMAFIRQDGTKVYEDMPQLWHLLGERKPLLKRLAASFARSEKPAAPQGELPTQSRWREGVAKFKFHGGPMAELFRVSGLILDEAWPKLKDCMDRVSEHHSVDDEYQAALREFKRLVTELGNILRPLLGIKTGGRKKNGGALDDTIKQFQEAVDVLENARDNPSVSGYRDAYNALNGALKRLGVSGATRYNNDDDPPLHPDISDVKKDILNIWDNELKAMLDNKTEVDAINNYVGRFIVAVDRLGAMLLDWDAIDGNTMSGGNRARSIEAAVRKLERASTYTEYLQAYATLAYLVRQLQDIYEPKRLPQQQQQGPCDVADLLTLWSIQMAIDTLLARKNEAEYTAALEEYRSGRLQLLGQGGGRRKKPKARRQRGGILENPDGYAWADIITKMDILIDNVKGDTENAHAILKNALTVANILKNTFGNDDRKASVDAICENIAEALSELDDSIKQVMCPLLFFYAAQTGQFGVVNELPEFLALQSARDDIQTNIEALLKNPAAVDVKDQLKKLAEGLPDVPTWDDSAGQERPIDRLIRCKSKCHIGAEDTEESLGGGHGARQGRARKSAARSGSRKKKPPTRA